MTEHIDEKIIIAESIIEAKDWLTFWRFSMHRGKHNTLVSRLFMIFWILIGPSLLIFDLYYFGLKYGNFLYLMEITDWLMAMIPLAITALYFYTRNIAGKRSFRKSKTTKGLKYHFEFKTTDFEASYTSDVASGTTTMRVDLLYKVYETKDFIYLYVNRRSAFILDKSSLDQSDALELKSRLQKVLRKKYIMST
jgi:hypothetical protein